jgi:hypothetical protein
LTRLKRSSGEFMLLAASNGRPALMEQTAIYPGRLRVFYLVRREAISELTDMSAHVADEFRRRFRCDFR